MESETSETFDINSFSRLMQINAAVDTVKLTTSSYVAVNEQIVGISKKISCNSKQSSVCYQFGSQLSECFIVSRW